MDSETEEIIKKQMKILPRDIINILADPALSEKILNIGKRNGLNTEQLGIFQLETNLVLLGLVHPDEYGDELRECLKADEMKVDNLVNDINREFLNGIRRKLIETFNADDESSTEQRPGVELDWRENLDFIFPSRDYFTPITLAGIGSSPGAEEEKTDKLLGSSNILEIKNRLLD